MSSKMECVNILLCWIQKTYNDWSRKVLPGKTSDPSCHVDENIKFTFWLRRSSTDRIKQKGVFNYSAICSDVISARCSYLFWAYCLIVLVGVCSFGRHHFADGGADFLWRKKSFHCVFGFTSAEWLTCLSDLVFVSNRVFS